MRQRRKSGDFRYNARRLPPRGKTMRHFTLILGGMLIANPLVAQQPPPKDKEKEKPKFAVKLNQVRVGFRAFSTNDGGGQFKVGMWTPVFVEIIAGQKGVAPKNPNAAFHLEFETAD